MAISSAYTFQAVELTGIPSQVILYQAARFQALAKELITITRTEPITADPDREIVDSWAEILGLARWTVSKMP